MRDYKGWTAKERLASLKKTKAALAAGVIPPPTKCNRCGKETGRIDYHNQDYSDPIKHLEQICQGCHTRLHRLENKDLDGKTLIENQLSADIEASVPNTSDQKKSSGVMPHEEKPDMDTAGLRMQIGTEKASSALNSWLERGMSLPLQQLIEHVRVIPVGVPPLRALRGLGIVFSNGFTKDYDCVGYPQKKGIGRNSKKFDVVLERVRFHERTGESLRIKCMPLSEKLESNFIHNK